MHEHSISVKENNSSNLFFMVSSLVVFETLVTNLV